MRGSPERDISFLGAGGEGPGQDPGGHATAAARPGGSKEVELPKWDLQSMKKNVRPIILQENSVRSSWKQSNNSNTC